MWVKEKVELDLFQKAQLKGKMKQSEAEERELLTR